jgi:serine/threonine protein kinase
MRKGVSRGSRYYIASELAEAGDLYDYSCTNGKLDTATALIFFKQMVNGVDYLHS